MVLLAAQSEATNQAKLRRVASRQQSSTSCMISRLEGPHRATSWLERHESEGALNMNRIPGLPSWAPSSGCSCGGGCGGKKAGCGCGGKCGSSGVAGGGIPGYVGPVGGGAATSSGTHFSMERTGPSLSDPSHPAVQFIPILRPANSPAHIVQGGAPSGGGGGGSGAPPGMLCGFPPPGSGGSAASNGGMAAHRLQGGFICVPHRCMEFP